MSLVYGIKDKEGVIHHFTSQAKATQAHKEFNNGDDNITYLLVGVDFATGEDYTREIGIENLHEAYKIR
jgi:hypothetical protein